MVHGALQFHADRSCHARHSTGLKPICQESRVDPLPNFIIASNITYSPQYDNLISNLTAYGLTQNVDYSLGIVGVDGGLQALQLAFVPEPSTVLLRVGGGLVLWRARRRNG